MVKDLDESAEAVPVPTPVSVGPGIGPQEAKARRTPISTAKKIPSTRRLRATLLIWADLLGLRAAGTLR